ncbi:hypothetical protein BJX63DRAFT_335446 [Aspergillus granulosus]|uniref:Uncharacterized protein n=1 Tax=Aspergillus granulosus TaxID=176169 RepID=A0ABR4HX00_9EURO
MTNKSKKKAQDLKELISNSGEQPRDSEVENLIADITKGTESSFHTEGSKPVKLPLQQNPVNELARDPEKQELTVTNFPKEGSFRRRIRALTGGSNRSSTAGTRQSWESKSSSTKSSRVWLTPSRDSRMSQDGEGKSLRKKKGEDASPTPGVLRYIRSPHGKAQCLSFRTSHER